MTARITLLVDGRRVESVAGRPLGAVLHGEGNPILRRTAKGEEPRGLFCGMGICFECLVTVDGRPNIRACITPVSDGMRIETGRP
ncbi:2Fe-2S iron-sulfur cluster binding domain-containing protein [Kaistia soli DSM 19436]|uniref:2Fe-2S iron-sulfur cluster binding domain-containing protein n=1 Tax=Kaistia soli DSM 19436 TaxID=1122133 RepID=A0A1M5FXB9_9HYPH|nr:(2Fe-2S)-binding protein [Kaistia soli]SHF96148.1 2Fe-2S iron-sulfur cluster binding domain-containing protein [Kaistia soli DSM 19436]